MFPGNPEKCARPGPEGLVDLPAFRGLKPPAPSGVFDLRLSFLEKWPADGLPVEGVDGEGDLLTIDGIGLDVHLRLRQFGNRSS